MKTSKQPNSRRRDHRLVLLLRRLKAISGMDPNVSLKTARNLTDSELEDELRDFARWYRSNAENTAQAIEGAIYDALDDEENSFVQQHPKNTPE